MGLFNHAHALRAALVACGVALLGPVTAGHAAAPEFKGTLGSPATEPSQPFHLWAAPVFWGGLVAKWQGVTRKLDDERVQLALCDGDRDNCASDAALRLLSIIDSGRQHQGRARLGEINRAINLAIRPMSDLAQFGQEDVWSSPLVTFYRGAGDCEDYAIAKFVALRMAGIPSEDLRIVVLVDVMRGEGHAVAAVRLDGHWLILDNRRMAMVEDVAFRNYRPLFVIDQSGVMKYSDAPLLASGGDRGSAPAVALSSLAQPAQIAAGY
jgi:predicted transglutaminase-like cysteine proteinase